MRHAPASAGSSAPPAEPAVDLPRRLRLVVLTDQASARPRKILDIVADALKAGAPAIQLRDKHLPPRDLLPLARRLRADTRAAGALLFVNDRLDLALAVDADGVHLGPDDLPVAAARALAPRGFLIGCSASSRVAARTAQADGADYLGCGAVFPTLTKTKPEGPIGLAGLAAVASAVTIPVVGIGGITPARAASVLAAGAAGVALASAVMAASDPARVVRSILR